MKQRAYQLMKEWCDTLLDYQIHTHTPYTNNALVCPACHVIHGRIADLCFPMTVIWSKTGEKSYLEQADKLIDWTEFNLKRPDGLLNNDAGNPWVGTSVYSAAAIGECLYHFKKVLPEKYKTKWEAYFISLIDAIFCLDQNNNFHPVTNYLCGLAEVIALAWRLTENKNYYDKAQYWLNLALSRLDREGLIYGEGPASEATDGSHNIDMGYNLEESIPLLLRYATLTGEHEEFFRQTLRIHLDFLLPDGGIDNSFGSRHNKWTYWGSRTSDGLVAALALVLDDPLFSCACEKVLTLYERCTHSGLLAMPMAQEASEPTCLHHSFTHAKALATLVCAENVPFTKKRVTLPCEIEYGVKSYQNGNLCLLSKGGFRATFSAVKSRYLPEYSSNAGASMNLLYHRNYGIICAATSAKYVPSEPFNQQYLRNTINSPCMTAQFVVDGKMGCMDKDATLFFKDTEVIATAAMWRAIYTVSDKQTFDIILECSNGIYQLLIVCKKGSCVTYSEDLQTICIDNTLIISSDSILNTSCEERVFHQVGGLMYLPISLCVQGRRKLSISCI